MAIIVKLDHIVEALELPQDWEAWLDPETGEIITISNDDLFDLEDEDDDEDLDSAIPEWQQESLALARRALESDTFLRLPDRFDVHEWDIMRRFAQDQDDAVSRQLLDAIHGRGAFRMFRATLDRCDLRDDWFRYRTEALRRIARDWLERNGIAWV